MKLYEPEDFNVNQDPKFYQVYTLERNHSELLKRTMHSEIILLRLDN